MRRRPSTAVNVQLRSAAPLPRGEFRSHARTQEGGTRPLSSHLISKRRPRTYVEDGRRLEEEEDEEEASAGRERRRRRRRAGRAQEAAHHEVAAGQHEIDFKYGDALATADRLAVFRFVVRRVARDMGLHATFMPKPIFGENGSGMHVHQSLFDEHGNNVFFDGGADWGGISQKMRWYIGGLLKHATALVAITNPTVNSYKRLVPGYEAPTHLAWSMKNRSPLIRIPERRGVGTRIELRMPDPSCNPYLAFAAMLAAGLDGIKNEIEPPQPVTGNVYSMSQRERSRLKIKSLPGNLGEALDALEKNTVLKDALGEHCFDQFIGAKRAEWQDYIASVHPWELDRYLKTV